MIKRCFIPLFLIGMGIEICFFDGTARDGIEMHDWAGYIFIVFGIALWLWPAKKSEAKPEETMLICRDCFQPASTQAAHIPCPNCGGELEKMEGFFDRHPEARNKETILPSQEELDKTN